MIFSGHRTDIEDMDFHAKDAILSDSFPTVTWWNVSLEIMDKSIFTSLPVDLRIFSYLYIPPFFTTEAYPHAHGFRPLQNGQPELAGLPIYSRLHLRHTYTLLMCQ